MSSRIINTYILMEFLFMLSHSFPLAMYVMFLLSRGCDYFTAGLVNLAFMLGIFIFEIPTGAFADTLGRKYSFALSCIILSVGLTVYFFSFGFLMFVLAEVIIALAVTFYSGALQAWVVDTLDASGYVGEKDKIFARGMIGKNFSLVVGGLLGVQLGKINMAYPFACGAGIALLTFLIAYVLMSESHFERKPLNFKNGVAEMRKVALDSIKYGVKHSIVFLLILTTIVAMFFMQGPLMYWQPFFVSLGEGELSVLGYMWIGISLAMICGNQLAIKVKEVIKNRAAALILFLSLESAAILLAAILLDLYVAILCFVLFSVGRGTVSPIKLAYLNEHIPSDKRATVLSFNSMMGTAGAGIGLVTLGLIAKHYSIRSAWIVAAIVLFIVVPLYIMANRKEKELRT